MKIRIKNFFEVLDTNYVLICTSNSVEKQAVNRTIKNRCELIAGIDSLGCCIGLINEKFVIHLSGESGIERNKSISRLIIEFINRDTIPKPVLIVLAGFCWGNPNKVNKDNVVISSDIISLNSNSYLKDTVEYKGSKFSSEINASFLESSIKNEFTDAVIGELASMETLVANGDKRDSIVTLYPNILGGEMEAFGFVPSLKKIPWVIVKAISDFASDDFDRDQQVTAAKRAVEMTRIIIGLYESEEQINLNTTSSSNLSLVHSLVGKSIKVTQNDVNPSNLNDYLDNLAPLVQYKLSYYLTGDEYGSDFVKYFSYLILETVQNAFKHGNASQVSINFEDKSIFIHDNGNDYELNQLTGDKGGAFSWFKVKSNFIDTGFIQYSFGKKKHKFTLLKLNENITRIISECTATIVKGKIGAGWGSEGILSYSDDCETVYVDDRQVNMPSRRFSLVYEVKRMIEAGKIIFVSVSDNDDATHYQGLGFSPEKLKIMVHK